MVKPIHRSRSSRKVKIRTPKGRSTIRYEPRKTRKPECAKCGKVLHGMVHGTHAKLRKASKTQKRPQRPYGGNLCSLCSRREIINKARQMVIKNE